MGISPCGGPGRPTHPDCTPTRPRLDRKQVPGIRTSLTVTLAAATLAWAVAAGALLLGWSRAYPTSF